MGLLDLAKSICEKNQKKIVSQERKSKHHAYNKDLNDVRQFKLDGNLVKQKTCCDYLLLNDTKKQAYFIELKGRDINKGIKQLECGVEIFRPELMNYEKFYRLVYTKARTHSVESNDFRKFKENNKKYFKYKENILEEDI